MIKKLLLGALSIYGLNANSQVVPNIDWVNYKSDRSQISNVPSAIDANNNAFITGYMFATPTNANAVTVKYDPAGVELWSASYDNGGFDNSKAIVLDAVGNSYVTGESDGTGTGLDIITIKYAPNGTQLWAKRFNGSFNGNDVGNSITVDPSGNVYVTGYTTIGSGNRDYITIKYDANGVQQFAVTFSGTGNQNDEAVAVAFSNNRLYVTGTAINSGGNSDLLTIRLNPANGNTVWMKAENGTANSNDVAYALLAYNNDVVVVGVVNNNSTGNDYLTVRYNGNNGNAQWSKVYDFANANNYATAITADASGNFAITGVAINGTIYEYHTLLYSNSGVQQWVNKASTGLNYSSANPQIAVDAIANHFYVCGQKSGVGSDIYVYQITPSGNRTWEQTFNGAQNNTDAAVDLVVNSSGVIYVAGASLNSSAKFDYTTIKISQTPVYFPTDFSNQSSSRSHLYLKNEGQLRKTDSTLANEVLYYTPNSNPEVYVEKNAFNFVFAKVDTSDITLDTLERIQCNFVNSNTMARYYDYKPQGNFYNFFLGYAASPAITDLRANERVYVPNFYPNIDLHYYSNKDGIKYYFVAKPGAKLDLLKLNIAGAVSTYTTGSNSLFIDGALGDVELNQPVAYQLNMFNQVVPLGAATWASQGSNNYGFNVPTYNFSMPLVIMVSKKASIPSAGGASGNLDYSTYYGRTANDVFNDIKVAPNGDRAVVGNTDGADFPAFLSFQPYKGFKDVVLLKYSVVKDSLISASFYGGAGDDFGNSVDINSAGEVFIGGQTFSQGSSGIPIQALLSASNQTANGGFGVSGSSPGDGFIARFSSTGNVLGFSRYYGGSQDDGINSIYIDNADNFYFTGQARSNNITMVNASQAAHSGTAVANNDVILGKFNNANVIVYSTYFGAAAATVNDDIGRDITVDGTGNAIVVGSTNSAALPHINLTGNSNTFYKTSLGGARDGFIARYSPTGAKQFASYFGGNGTFGIDEITRVNYNATKDEICFAGQSNDTTNFPYVNLLGAFNLKRKATNAAFIASMSSNLTKQWCTSYGKTAATNFSVTGLTSDNAGIIYLTGQAKSSTLNYPLNTPTLTVYEDTLRNADDGFVAVFNPQKDIFHAHYLGGTGNDYINNANVGANNKLYVVGQSGSTNFPIAYTNINVNFIDSTFGGGQYDGFITRFDMNTIQIINVKELTDKASFLSVYPNPAVSGFVIQLKDAEIKNSNLKVYSLMGQLITEKQITQNQTQISCESWANGVYLINVNLNGSLQTFKLIKN
jgi:hypothetical protein